LRYAIMYVWRRFRAHCQVYKGYVYSYGQEYPCSVFFFPLSILTDVCAAPAPAPLRRWIPGLATAHAGRTLLRWEVTRPASAGCEPQADGARRNIIADAPPCPSGHTRQGDGRQDSARHRHRWEAATGPKSGSQRVPSRPPCPHR
jgi:hypothetical protein